MAGYLGTKAVFLSTTAASVGGDATISGDLTVDTNTLYVDSTNNRVGIGNASPAQALDVTGDIVTSGGVYLGGTGAANKLDDYEEGTWTPVWNGSTSNPSATYNVQQGFYTKIGKVVHVFARMDNATYSGGSGELRIGGLPFVVSNQADYYPAMPVSYKASFVTTGPDWARFNRNLSSATLYADNNTSETQLNPANVQASTNVIFSGSYETDS